MKRLLLPLFCCCLLSERVRRDLARVAARSGSGGAGSAVSQTRGNQLKSEAELNALGSRIEELKSQAKGKLLPGSELDAALKRSQELSGVLTEMAQSLSTKQAELESANVALLTELSNALTSLKGQFDRQTDRDGRRALIAKMRTLRQERESIRAALPAARLPALEAVKPSDDPEDLLEQADLVKDNEDKVRRELKVLEKRIAEAKEERDLDGRVRQFLGEDALFDDQDRRLHVQKTTDQPGTGLTDSAAAPRTMSPQFSAGGQSSDKNSAQFPPPVTSPSTGPTPTTDGTQGAPPAGGFDPAAPGGTPTVRVSTGTDSRPAIGGQGVAGHGDDDDLEDLEIQRAKLKGLAEELKVRASQLQKKAAELK